MTKWFFVLLLTANVLYLGWEINNETRAKIINASGGLKVPDRLEPLYLLSELEQLPESRSVANISSIVGMQENSAPPAGLMDIESFASPSLVEDAANKKSVVAEAGLDEMHELTQPACFAYGPLLDADESDRLAHWFVRRNVRIDRRQTEEQDRQLFRVHLAPQESTTVAIESLQDLITKGVRDVRLIGRGDLKNAISLGLFFSQTEVNERLAEIKGKGYQPVIVPHYGQNKVHWIDVLADKADAVFTEMLSGLPSRYNSTAINCTDAARFAINP